MPHIRRASRPSVIKLPDGNILSVADLPPEDTIRWTRHKKITVALAVEHDLIDRNTVLQKYRMAPQELREWHALSKRYHNS